MTVKPYELERDAYDPRKVIGAIRDCSSFVLDTIHGRSFFDRTVNKVLINENPEEIDSIISAIMGGVPNIIGTRAYLLESSRPPIVSPKNTFNSAEHSDPMPRVLAICYVGSTAVRLRDPINRDTERIDLYPGDRLKFDATNPHAFVPLEPRRSLSIPYIHQ